MNTERLECHAVDAHRLNWTWDRFWQAHGDATRGAEPWNRQRYRRLVNRLLSLVVSGDTGGMEPAGNGLEPWEADDQAKPHDTITHARLLADSLPGV